MDIETIIKTARLGRARKEAQVDTCTVFAAALYDLLSENMPCKMVTAVSHGAFRWAHAVVEVDGRYYDSMGEFSIPIYRARAKLHPTVKPNISFQADSRQDCYEPEFDEMHAFYLQMLTKAARSLV
ncbi:hypothetical protein F2S72_08850 [Pseudomonas syringae pv. actinidiae]|nr:hypothetical protein [Pseudomonas syringae pv. actinidiae]